MLSVKETETFKTWIKALRDVRARNRINTRIHRLAQGNSGDTKNLGGSVFELRVDYGPGYRVYYMQWNLELIILLVGGDKSTQPRDIKTAKGLAKALIDRARE
jgi:putative addiction module killer protein